MTEPSDNPRKKGSWVDRLLILIAIVCIGGYGVQWYLHKRSVPKTPITGEVAGDLNEADRIPVQPGELKDMNVLVVTMDTVRADHLGCYGNRAIRTPELDSLAHEGVLFSKFYTSVPSTLPSHCSIMTGLYPASHGVRANGTFRLGEDQTTLAEILKPEGYETGAILSAYVLDSEFGLSQGFDTYNDDLTKGIQYMDHGFRERPGNYTTDAAIEWLETVKDQKFFGWVHYFDPHAPYIPPGEFGKVYKDMPYNGEIAFVDSELRRLIQWMKDNDVYNNTILIITSDHGEGLGEHDEKTHCLLIYDSTLHVPLIITAPKLASRGLVVDRPVCQIDLVPTILDMLGVESDLTFDGASLVRGPEEHYTDIYAETITPMTLHGWAPLFGVRRGDEKFIFAPQQELYDLVDDPRELANLLLGKPKEKIREVADGLEDRVLAYTDGDVHAEDALSRMAILDPLTQQKLDNLGYVKSVAEVSGDLENLPDPKDMIGHWNRIEDAEAAYAQGHWKEAIAEWEACMEEVSGDIWTMRLLASAYLERGDLDRAIHWCEKAYAIEENEPGILLTLGRALAGKGQVQEGEEKIRQAIAMAPDHAISYVSLGMIQARVGELEQAVESFDKAIEMDPGTTGPYALVAKGHLYLFEGQRDPARAAFEKALEIDRLNGDALAGLATINLEEGNRAEAEKQLSLALKFVPNNTRVLAALAGMYMAGGQYDKAIEFCHRALDIKPDEALALCNLGGSLCETGKPDEAREYLEQAIEANPRFVEAIMTLGQVHLALREDERAVELYKQALEVNPKLAKALLNLGSYEARRENFKDAADYFVEALRVDPEYAMAYTYLGQILLRTNNMSKALECFEASYRLDPSQSGVKATIDKLKAAGVTTQPSKEPAEATTNS